MHEPIVNFAHAITALAETLALLEAASRSNAKRSSEHLVDDLLFPARDEVRVAFVGCGRQVTHPTLEHSLIDAFGGETLPVSDDHRQDASSLGIKHGPNPFDILVGSDKTPHFIDFDQDLDFFSGTSGRMSGESGFHYRTMEVTTTKLRRLARAMQVANRTLATDEQWTPVAFYVITLWKTLNTHENKGDPRKVDAIAT